ncbi:ubiquitin ligase (cullin) of SCF [Malassezia cuniculi]|uniref:Ubiquitin ligase (Cullin) of SCF n=1 Tax=Malassezia cuniculi TaxID=948313 RepID=A0AAF0ES58_9BASI|nr:ubiquitin ligase (cullin) of SCF [Malassezia cuniculi]
MERRTEGMSYERYMQLYTVAYNYCISSGMGGAGSSASLVGSELYQSIASFFEQHVAPIAAHAVTLDGEALIRYHAHEWVRYTDGANIVHRLLVYLNRHWIKHQREEGNMDIYPIYTLALIQWRRFVFGALQRNKQLNTAVMGMINAQRNGQIVESSMLKTVIDSYVSLGVDDIDVTRVNVDIYRSEFQQQFLVETNAFYRAESTAFLAANSMTDYLAKAETRIREEEDRVELYLHDSSRRPLIEVCQQVLLSDHIDQIYNEVPRLLADERMDDLARVYRLLEPVPGALEPLSQRFEEFALSNGHDTIARVEGGEAPDPSAYINALLRAHAHELRTVEQAFRSDASFVAALDKACRVYMNRNTATGSTPSKAPELLARYLDGILRKGHREDSADSGEDALQGAMTVFKYIEDRDFFLKFYAKFLARRLVTFASASDDAEGQVIAQLKGVCGFEYTSRLQRMLTEYGLSRELNDRFRENDSGEGPDFYCLVLASGIWPLQAPQGDFSVPAELSGAYDRFRSFYNEQHSRRVLSWLWHLSSNELHTSYLSRRYIFQTTTYQCAVLLLFNTHSVLTFDEIASATRISPQTLNTVLLPLVKSRVLHQLDSSYSLNMDFKSKKMRVNLQIPVRAEQRAESSEVAKTVDEDRKMLLQATIVRVMKARKTLRHNLLLPEVISLVQSRFQPRVPDIKRAIDTLIEKEFLTRVEGEKDVYEYVA